MADVSSIKSTDGTTYNVKDATLRTEVITARTNGDGITYQNLNARITNIETLIGTASS